MRAKNAKNRIRKSTKIIYATIASILLTFSFYGLMKGTQSDTINTKKEQIYTYTNKFNYDYKVNLIKNKYMKNKQTVNQRRIFGYRKNGSSIYKRWRRTKDLER